MRAMARTWTAADLYTAVFPATPWLARGLLAGQGYTLITALPKTGKTILALQLAHALAIGIPFLRARIDHPYRVAFVGADAPMEEYQIQTTAIWGSGHDALCFIRPEDPICTKRLTPEAQDTHAKIAAHQPDVVMFDALESLVMLDFNTHEGAQLMLRQFYWLAGHKPFLLVHHPRKPAPGIKEDMRAAQAGHHFLSAQASVLLSLEGIGPDKGRLDVLPRRGRAAHWPLRRREMTADVAVWEIDG